MDYLPMALGVLASALLLVFLYPTRYTLHVDCLLIRRGTRLEYISLARIKSVLLTGDPKAKDLPFRKVRLTLDNATIMLRPSKRGEFIRQVKDRAYL